MNSEKGKEYNVKKEELKLYQELLVEANAQLQLVQLPEEVFGKYEGLIRQTQYKALKENIYDGEDPRKAIKRLEIQAQTQ